MHATRYDTSYPIYHNLRTCTVHARRSRVWLGDHHIDRNRMANAQKPYPRPPLSLIVTEQEWVSLSLTTLFSPRGYAVLRSGTGTQACQRLGEAPVDLVVVDRDLRDMSGVDLVGRLQDTGLVSLSTPILLISTGHWPREEKMAA